MLHSRALYFLVLLYITSLKAISFHSGNPSRRLDTANYTYPTIFPTGFSMEPSPSLLPTPGPTTCCEARGGCLKEVYYISPYKSKRLSVSSVCSIISASLGCDAHRVDVSNHSYIEGSLVGDKFDLEYGNFSSMSLLATLSVAKNCSGGNMSLLISLNISKPAFPTLSPSPIPTFIPTSVPSEMQALSALYATTNGKYWSTSNGWLSGEHPCWDNAGWYGVTCTNSS